MKASKFTESQIAFVLKQGDEGSAVAEICRKAAISQATYFNGNKKFGGLLPSEVKRLRQLEEENTETESRAFCAEYFQLRAELASVTEAEQLTAQIASFQSESVMMRANGAGQDSDPQVSLLSRITGRERESVRLALVIAVALLVEIGASLGLFLASRHRSGSSRPIFWRATGATSWLYRGFRSGGVGAFPQGRSCGARGSAWLHAMVCPSG